MSTRAVAGLHEPQNQLNAELKSCLQLQHGSAHASVPDLTPVLRYSMGNCLIGKITNYNGHASFSVTSRPKDRQGCPGSDRLLRSTGRDGGAIPRILPQHSPKLQTCLLVYMQAPSMNRGTIVLAVSTLYAILRPEPK